ncbi:MAG: Glyoxalase/bleomycin resistance protein/dioxygenase [Flavisolibacter sp.]|jgi:predicted lactoylglutathione lyase|nr:Glyoxalase/bleomycin resistance protein/dioxygenase [Flavisolibacter sp.]
MATKIFVNLAVKDLDKSKEFFTKIGFTINPQFTNESGACVVISEDIYAMILREEFFKTFIANKDISDATKTTEVLVALSADSRESVDEMADKALAAGATHQRDAEDHGFMYSRSFQDLDGHIWEVFWMDMAAAPPAPEQTT